MTTLNARANQAYHALVEESGEDWPGFDHQRDAFEEGWATGYKTAEVDLNAALEAAAPLLGPRPLLDRDALGQVLISFGADMRIDADSPAEMFGNAVDAVMDLARPMPTREQIEATVRKTIFAHFGTFTGAVTAIVDDVEALLNGAES